MYFYNLNLQPSTCIEKAIHGNFSGGKQQEIVVSRGDALELLSIDVSTGKITSLLRTEAFAVIRDILSFKLTGSAKDLVVVGSDSGKIAVLEYNHLKNCFDKVHMETVGRSGCRRIVPGEFLTVDPKGRAVMIAAVEKQKLVYVFNRDANANLTISSPLEAHKSNTVNFGVAALDVGFENPVFACLEIDYDDADHDPTGEAAMETRQHLTYYELDLGLNHVVRRSSEPMEEYANMIFSVPSDNDGPGGLLICAENFLIYRNFGDQPDIRCPIPRRRDYESPGRNMIVVCGTLHKTKSMFFYLLQNEQGDVFKVTIVRDSDIVTEIRVKYFDSVPLARSLCVLKNGFLFVAAEFGNHHLYQIVHLGEDDDSPEFSSEYGDDFDFTPRPLKNLVLVDEMESLAPILNAHVGDFTNEDTPQVYAFCGIGPRSGLRILRHGLEVSEMAISELPGNPKAVWTVRNSISDKFDSFIVVSFSNATLVLSIGEIVEEVTDSGFLGTATTINCGQMGIDTLVQVHMNGIRHIKGDKRVNEWKVPSKRQIVCCALNMSQVVIGMTGGQIVYFELDSTGQLNEFTKRKEMSSDIICLAIGRLSHGQQRTRFVAVGLGDSTVRILSLDVHNNGLSDLSLQSLPALPESLCIAAMSSEDTLYLNTGLQNGVLLKAVLDPVTGDLSDTRTRYLGGRPVKLFRVVVQGFEGIMAASSRCWLSYHHQNRSYLTPISYVPLEYAHSFSSDQCPEGIVSISENTLRIISLDKLGVIFNQTTVPLTFTPRRMVVNPECGVFMSIETDNNCFTKETLKTSIPEVFGVPKAGIGMWASVVRLSLPGTGQTLEKYELPQNVAAVSITLARFPTKTPHLYLFVGTANKLVLNPKICSGGELYCYKISEDGQNMELLHRTPVEDVPGALTPFMGRLLVSVGKLLRLYEFGKKKMLRKCENKKVPHFITALHTMGNRVIAIDVQESFHFIRYRRFENQLVIFADDFYPRWITSSVMVDYDTIVGGDKFGNIFASRLPDDVNDDIDEDPTGNRALWDRSLMNGAFQKADLLNNYHLGQIITSIQKATFTPGGSETLVYTTISGSIGILAPFSTHDEHDFFQHLEMYMRNESSSLTGRSNLAYRSSYFPVLHVVDGTLCEMYNSLDYARQKYIAIELNKTCAEVAKKLEDIRTKFAF